ncbi:MAG: hypothetical protein E7559_05795 [Ruminococcaceae bacterium]|nr:hypothetical protein [Oscillospiraceae bacterium]
MSNLDLQAEEVILFEGTATSKSYKGALKITLTSTKIVIERDKGVFKKVRELVDVVELASVKFYNDVAQIKQHLSDVEIQTTVGKIVFSFSGMLEARKFTGKAVDAVTGTTLAKRVSDKTKGAFEMVDDTLGLDTRSAIKGVLEKGVKGVIIDGIGGKKK